MKAASLKGLWNQWLGKSEAAGKIFWIFCVIFLVKVAKISKLRG